MLEAIVKSKRAEVEQAKRERPVAELLEGLHPSDRDFQAAIGRRRTGFILECKRQSPSQGPIRENANPVDVASAYAPFADAISVLTDGPFFGGSLEDLTRVRESVAIPVLRKDFVVEPYQVVEARAAGADAVLLMLSVLGDLAWRACAAVARECGMGTLTEVHTEEELDRALTLDAPVIGINSRDLQTLQVDLRVIDRLIPRVPEDRLIVAESGIRSNADIAAMRDRADAFLVGTSLMREKDLAAATRRLIFGEVKVCGLTRADDARAAWESGASWGGLIFAEESPRRVDLERARAVRAGACLRWAGVFVNQSPTEVARIARALDLDAVQLHGDESVDDVEATRAKLHDGCEIWKAVRVRRDVATPRLADTGADRLLLDAYRPDARGGTGACFDWSVAAEHPDLSNVVLAGGLSPENAVIAGAVEASVLDVNSGVEEAPGIKSPTKLNAFFAALRGTGRDRP
jgi:indole-3-glycerol phosphate synthase/phosphoribosylanthranilate isomerase